MQITSGLGVLPQASFWLVFIIIIVLFFFRAYLFRSGEQDHFLARLLMDLLVREKWTEMLVPSLASTSSDWFFGGVVAFWISFHTFFGGRGLSFSSGALFCLQALFCSSCFFLGAAFFFCSGFCVGLFTDLEML